MVLDCYPVLQHKLSGTDLVSLVTIGLQTRTQSEGSGLAVYVLVLINYHNVTKEDQHSKNFRNKT